MEPLLSAFENFYDTQSDALYRSVYFRVGSNDHASDIVQEAFVRVWKNWSTYESDSHRTRALFAIARNLIIDHYRSRSRTQSLEAIEKEWADTTSVGAGELIDRSIDHTYLARALQSLPEHERSIIVEHTINNISYTELSRQLNKPEPTIRKIHSRALSKLKHIFHTLYGTNNLSD